MPSVPNSSYEIGLILVKTLYNKISQSLNFYYYTSGRKNYPEFTGILSYTLIRAFPENQ